MKKYTILIILIFAGTFGFAQSDTIVHGDTTRIKLGRTEVVITKDLEIEDSETPSDMDGDYSDYSDRKKSHKHSSHDNNNWVHLYSAHGISGFVESDIDGPFFFNEPSARSSSNDFELEYPRSRSYTFSLILDGLDIVKDRWYITSGIGFTQNKYFFKNDLGLVAIYDTSATTPVGIEPIIVIGGPAPVQNGLASSFNTTLPLANSTTTELKRLKVTYLEVPIITGFRFGNLNRAVGIQLGVIGGVRINSKVGQTKLFSNGIVIKDDFGLNPFKLDLFARISIGDIGLFGRYSMTSLFEENGLTKNNAFAMGISFSIFDGY